MNDANLDPIERLALLERRLNRANLARQEAEALLERRSRELERSNRDLRKREEALAAQLDIGNRNLLHAQRLGGIATFFATEGESFRSSEAMADILGLPTDQPVTVSDVARALHPLDRDRIIAIQMAFFATAEPGTEYRHECRIIRPEQSVRWLRWFVRRDLTADGNSTIISGTVQDITEQRRAQRQTKALQLIGERNMRRLRQTKALLAERVAELERSATALAESHARTEAAHRAKSRFLSMMSHKVRTPMNGVTGMMTALAQTNLDPDQARQLTLAREAGDELRLLIDEIIDIADTGPETVERRAADKTTVTPSDTQPLRVAGRRPLILVAEDIETNQIVLTSMLDTLGCDHVVVGNGALAVDRVTEGGIDAILMDIQMPVMDGTEATRQIRQLSGRLGRIPIIGVTAQAIQSERDALRAVGMNNCLAKPITVPLLAGALRGVLDGMPAIDTQVFLTAMGAMPAGQRAQLFDQIGRDLSQLAGDFVRANAERDLQAARRARHSLIGVAGNFGVSGLTRLLVAIDDVALLSAETAADVQATVSAAISEGQALLTAAAAPPHNRRSTDR